MAGKKGKSKRSKSGKGKKDGKRRRRSSRSGARGGGFYRVDAQGNRCAGFANSVSPLGNECFWAMRTPGIPRAYRQLVPPMRAPEAFARALNVANPSSSYQLRGMGVSSGDARRIAELNALRVGGNQFADYQLGRALQKGRFNRALPLLAGGGAIDPMMAMAMGGRGFDPLLFSASQGKIDPLTLALLRGRK